MFKNDLTPIGEDFREGLTAIVSVQVPEPQFESQTKMRLNNPEVEGIVASVGQRASEQVTWRRTPRPAQKIMKKVILAAEAREAAAKAKKALKDRKSILNSRRPARQAHGLHQPRPRRDRSCSWWRATRPAARPRAAATACTRPSCRLRGKPLNVEKARPEKVLSNEEICSLISAVGIDIGNSEDIEQACATARSCS